MTTTAIPQRAWVEQIMGLPISVHLRGDDLTGSLVEQQVAAVFAELRIVDSGPGVPQREREALFAPFRRSAPIPATAS